jgi:hypothetical protein
MKRECGEHLQGAASLGIEQRLGLIKVRLFGGGM